MLFQKNLGFASQNGLVPKNRLFCTRRYQKIHIFTPIKKIECYLYEKKSKNYPQKKKYWGFVVIQKSGFFDNNVFRVYFVCKFIFFK
jgi:hypothetical protein